jgi:hypothetical protein
MPVRLRGTGGDRGGVEPPPELVELRRAVEASFAMRREAVIIEKDGTRHIGAAKDPGWRPDPHLITQLEQAEVDFTDTRAMTTLEKVPDLSQ